MKFSRDTLPLFACLYKEAILLVWSDKASLNIFEKTTWILDSNLFCYNFIISIFFLLIQHRLQVIFITAINKGWHHELARIYNF